MRVGILGATGAVGQTFVRLLDGHPWFEVAAVAASDRSAGKTYRVATNWMAPNEMPERVAGMVVRRCDPEAFDDCDFVFSALDAVAATEIELAFAASGIPVMSNARSHRMDPMVPLLIPEVNPDHIALNDHQPGSGFIVTNPNCSVVGLAMALKPLHDAFGVEQVHVVTMQALSGAGYPGVASLDALGNVVPHIGGEEEKIETEPRKILGTLVESAIEEAQITISAQCNRVPVIDGHLESVSVRLGREVAPEEAREVLRAWPSPLTTLNLPSAPKRPLRVYDEPHFPQPRLHAMNESGMQVSIGRLATCPVLGLKFVVLSHNTIRGAAGGAILNAELLAARLDGPTTSGDEDAVHPATRADIEDCLAPWRRLQDDHEQVEARLRRSKSAERRWRKDFPLWAEGPDHGVFVAEGGGG